MQYSKKRKISALYPSSKGTVVSRYRGYKSKGKKKVVRYRYTNPQPWWNPKTSPEMKAFDFWDNTGGHIPAYQNVVYTDGGDGTNTLFKGFTSINRIKQGSTYANRIGAKVTMKHITVSFSINNDIEFVYDALANNINQNIRALLIYDKNPNGVAPNGATLLQATGMGALNSVYSSLPNIVNMKNRFLFLRDQYLNYSRMENIKHYKWEVDCSLPSVYTGIDTETPSIANIAQGALYLMVFANYENLHTMYFGTTQARVYFVDQ